MLVTSSALITNQKGIDYMEKYSTETETWKDIEGYEGKYQVSNFGRIKSLERKEYMARNNCYRVRKEKVLKPDIDKQGYEKVRLYKNGKGKNIFVHRLVAIAFIKNPNKHPIINHIDEVPLNNHVSNLEWCTYSYNSTYGGAEERKLKNIWKAIQSTNVETGEVKTYRSAADAERESNGYFKRRSISRVCTGERPIHKGHRWEFV